MAAASPSMDVKEELKCPICMEYLTDLVTLDCGHNFCRSCITRYCETWEDLGDLECPLCKARIKKGNFRPNWQLANVVEKIKYLSLNLGKEELCARHKEKLNLFCKEDQELVCVRCERSPEHRSHTVLLLEEAAEEYKDQLCSCLDVLREEQERILANKAGTEKESEDLLSLIEAEKTKGTALFDRLHQFLEEQKKRFLSQMEELEKEIATRREEHMARLLEELSSLEGLIQQMEAKSQLPASELLQDIGRTLRRSEKKEASENPVAFPPELTCRVIRGFCDIKPLLEGVMKQFSEELRQMPLLTEELSQIELSDTLKMNKSQSPAGNQPRVLKEGKNEDADLLTKIRNLTLKKVMFKKGKKRDLEDYRQVQASEAKVTLDPDTANVWLVLSEDHKSVRWGVKWQALPNNPERFDCQPCVLGREGFTAGRHFWEVTVGAEGNWAVGVARKSVSRKGLFRISPQEGIWAVGKWGLYKAFNAPVDTSLTLSQVLQRIRVTLDCAGGQVAFSDVDTGVHLYTYSGVPFCGETLLPFFWMDDKAHLRLSP